MNPSIFSCRNVTFKPIMALNCSRLRQCGYCCDFHVPPEMNREMVIEVHWSSLVYSFQFLANDCMADRQVLMKGIKQCIKWCRVCCTLSKSSLIRN